jgi:NAD(P)H-hydrate repair Nnr-like enzyme with NAD(P)H-hydrate epimerase domain
MDPGLKILTAKESQYCDQQTALLESMNEHDLMERAAIRLFQHICKQNEGNAPLHIICGPGNNG